MKTAITLPNKLFYLAEAYAEKHGMTRNELYTIAVREFIKNKTTPDKKEITPKINAVCMHGDTSLKPEIGLAAKQILTSSEW